MTFLFTDIEGSTRRWEADAEVMRAALSKHDQVLQTAIESHGGFLFSHTGDGVVAAFASPRSAVDAAVKAQLALELPVRMGIATGEAELRDGDYFGTVLNRAARVMAAGHGGQILVADSTAGLLSGVDLLDLGPRRLRDVPDPITVFQLRAPGLAEDFPPLRTLDPSPGNLRQLSTSFIGRESEIAEIVAAMAAHRLVTLTGVGGVGKTRLATEVAARLTDEFADGVWFFELAAVADPAAVPDAVAAVLGITQQPGKSVTESVAAALEGRDRLLVFDNCEHVRDAAADLVEAILSHSATVRVLATGREGLGVVDEQLWLVPSLDVGAGIDSSAVALFAERARSVASRFGLATTDEATAVVEICRRLDGIPLAIELAASRIASMTVDEINDRLGSRFKLLVGSRRGLGRHQTLRHAVAWSYELLDGAEKALLERCSVFAGGFDLKSACAVTGSAGGDDYAVLDLLDALVRKSLLVADQSAGRTRFSMLETIREFAEEQLAASGEADAARTAHARYFASRETEVLSLWDSPRQRQAHEWFILELPNLRAAFRCAVEHDDLDSAAALAVYATFLGFWVNQHEPITWTEEILKSAQAVQHRKLAQLYVMAAHCYGTGRMDDFHAHTRAAQEAIDSGRFDEVPDMFDATDHGGYLTTDPASAAERCRTRIAHDPDNRPYTRHTLVIALSTAGATDEAIAVADRVLDIDHSADNPELQSGALLAYGFAHREDDPAAAYECHRRGLAIASESWNRQIESIHAISLSRLAATGSNPMEAFTFLTQSLGNLYDSGSFSMMSGPLAVLAGLFDRLAHPEPAAVIAGFTRGSFASFFYPELATAIAHLRMVLGDDSYESLARTGETMTAAQMVTYAYDQIDQARSKSSSAVDRYDPDHDSIPDDPSSPETLVP